ncbi:DNA photolyase FAD-binding domain protein (macronuclear) [Tetrahymena thermophila SB210]|uniref:DNA photolyase FAD-binding domain protein n=1 Tax=Tetrahymena thermophila (strain SB210) TaxID=312017 RepID=Q23DL8_TETTS|nr:DNA photolyase FAD-binding domain protein [Tetrahymena thermophila SB210]EAR94547.1 DNA photolyase FAD-binding domain protein [Tetrahymena thermophila SB210]|eukprot:XP_001014668.1 DNA photolyase FAD-binding domain protein [Tetrahymena thermophila SB210]
MSQNKNQYKKEEYPLKTSKRKREAFEEGQAESKMIEEDDGKSSKKQQDKNAKQKRKVSIFWFRRDLRLNDNTALYNALKSQNEVVPLFIFDTEILDKLEDKKDARVEFIHLYIMKIQEQLKQVGSTLIVKHGTVDNAFKELVSEFDIQSVYVNRDYESSAKQRDERIKKYVKQSANAEFYDFKDQVIFEASSTNKDGSPYKVFTPYSKKWLSILTSEDYSCRPSESLMEKFWKSPERKVMSLEEIGFEKAGIPFPSVELNEKIVKNYDKTRDTPSIEGTTRMSVHLRFGTVSIRDLVRRSKGLNATYLNELIWRDFYMMILDQFPHVENNNFKPAYDKLVWRNNVDEFMAWCEGKTGYHLVDAGMRQLNQTGYMHNRVRMVVASFLTKHLLIDWKWGERYFASKLLDYDLSANNGGWQWAAGTGTDAQPYFRIFNPDSQQKKFDPNYTYIKTWIKDLNTKTYPKPIVDHKLARERCLQAFKKALGQ